MHMQFQYPCHTHIVIINFSKYSLIHSFVYSFTIMYVYIPYSPYIHRYLNNLMRNYIDPYGAEMLLYCLIIDRWIVGPCMPTTRSPIRIMCLYATTIHIHIYIFVYTCIHAAYIHTYLFVRVLLAYGARVVWGSLAMGCLSVCPCGANLRLSVCVSLL